MQTRAQNAPCFCAEQRRTEIFAERRTAQNGRRGERPLGGSRPGQGGDGNGPRQRDTPAPARSVQHKRSRRPCHIATVNATRNPSNAITAPQMGFLAALHVYPMPC